MGNNEKEKVVFYGQLPKPSPVIKPNDKIQLQPTINPIAITPYVDMDDDLVAQSADVVETKDTNRGYRILTRISGAITFIISVVSLILFALAITGKSVELFKDADLSYFYNEFGILFNDFDIKTSITPLAIVCAMGLIAINCILSIISIIFAKRFGYSFLAFVAFILLVVAAFYEIKFFSDIKNIGTLLDRECGWPSIMLMIVGGANLVFAIISAIICPKNRIVKSVEF